MKAIKTPIVDGDSDPAPEILSPTNPAKSSAEARRRFPIMAVDHGRDEDPKRKKGPACRSPSASPPPATKLTSCSLSKR
jgi:hypothetical protein